MSVAITEAPSQDQLDRLRDQGDRPEWVGALPLAELEAKGRAVVKRAGKQVALFVTRAGVRAIANRCPHEGYPLSEGTLAEPSGAGTGDACTLTCNWHNWKFDLETGEEASGGEELLDS